jgi:hypothetical protein
VNSAEHELIEKKRHKSMTKVDLRVSFIPYKKSRDDAVLGAVRVVEGGDERIYPELSQCINVHG